MLLTAAHGRLAQDLPAGTRDDRDQRRQELAAAGFDPDRLAEADRRLLRLLAAFDLTLELALLDGNTVWLALVACTVETADGGQVTEACVGKGWRPEQAVRGCLGEVAELRSWLARGTEPVRTAIGAGPPEAVLTAADILGTPASPCTAHAELEALWRCVDDVPPAWCCSVPLAWCQLEGFARSDRPVLAPAALCYGKAPGAWSGGMPSLIGDSNGCAAGPDPATAELAALLEVVERDATGIWWYGAYARPELGFDAEPPGALGSELARRRRQPRRTWLLDLTHDLGIPVVAAVSIGPDGRLPAIGVAASLSYDDAAERALLELRQTEVSLSNCLRRWRNEGSSPPLPGEGASRAWLAGASSDRLPWLLPAGRIAAPATGTGSTAGAGVERCCRALQSAGLHAYRLDLTREDIRVPVAEVVVPGACHRKPRLGLPRLWQVPAALGWQRPAPSGVSMRPFPLLI